MQTKLYELYKLKWETLNQKIEEIKVNPDYNIKPTNPLLLSLENNDYENSDIKLMIFGQETNSWYGEFNPNMDQTLKLYDTFFNDGYALSKYGGQFWNGINRFLVLLSIKYPTKKIGLIWNNVVKIGCEGRNQNRPPEHIYKIEREYFDVIKDEIEILKPNVILFLSGPNYDYSIKNTFGEFSTLKIHNDFTERQISKLDIGYGENVFRTYHPSYVWRKGINNYFNAIIQDIKL